MIRSSPARVCALALLVVFAACKPGNPKKQGPQVELPPGPHYPENGATYKIISDNLDKGLSKRTVAVLLSKRVWQHDIEKISEHIIWPTRQAARNHFVDFYLPSMKVSAGAWAVYRRTKSDSRCEILGATIARFKELAKKPMPEADEILGCWFDNSPMIGGRVTIFRKADKYYVQSLYYRDSSSSTKGLLHISKPSKFKMSFSYVPPTRLGDFLAIKKDGDLLFYDGDGPIAAAKPLRSP